MLRTITFTTQKGGTGKSTLATSLAVAATEAGEKVVAFDLDQSQGSLADWRADRAADNIHVEPFPASQIAQLPALMKALGSKGFTLAILDTPGADTTATHKAMEAADLCLVPIRPTKLDAKAVRKTVQALMRGASPWAFLLNQCPPQPNNSRAPEMASGLSALGYLAEPMVMMRADYQDAYASGQGVTEYAPDGKAAEEMRTLWRWVDKQMQRAKG